MVKAIFETDQELAKLMIPTNRHDPDRDGKYLDDGLKPVEAFCSDIMQNLVAWGHRPHESIYYRTKDYIYQFYFNSQYKIIEMTRWHLRKYDRLDSWANMHTVAPVGSTFCKANVNKWVPVAKRTLP